ncbi:hypothetical protein CCZ37_04890 [Vibrio qinghaiensis]|uniref:Uncharacterized protein n=1 Tax=Vibrio qinghaiensis TaxID=2025808 RepID=A0A223MWM0_9VIBR|nr:hypothetical protein [Vibrio qinghaiensis]ASU21968.1 hypothetical protein CCZ37_04890 [Vibrio qinghaiensis]
MDQKDIIDLIEYIKVNFNRQMIASEQIANGQVIQSIDELRLWMEELSSEVNDPLSLFTDHSHPSEYIDKILSIAKDLSLNFSSKQNKIKARTLIRKCQKLMNEQEQSDSNILKEFSDKLDRKTGQHEKHLERIKSDAINDIRSETSELKEQLQDELKRLFEDRYSDFRSSVNSQRNEIRKNSDELVNQLHNEFRAKIDDLNDRFDITVGERIEHFERRFSQLQTRNTEITTSITNIESSISEAISESKDSILKDVYKLQDEAQLLKIEISNASKQLTRELKIAEEKAKEKIVEAINEEIAQYKKVKELLNIQVTRATDIVGTLSKKAMAHEHIIQANREFKTFLVHQILGVIFLLGAVAMSIAIFSNSLGINVPWLSWLVSVPTQTVIDPTTEKIIATTNLLASEEAGSLWFFKRISILILLTAPGIYFLKEAAVHRSKENVYRQRGVQLAAIAPYLNELEPCERQGIKKDLVKTFFSFHDGKADTKNVPDFLRDLKETMKIVRSIDKLDPHNRVRKVKRSTEES